MIIHPCTGLHDARLPQLEEGEEEIFFRHPVHPLKVNQIGMIYFDEGFHEIEHSHSGGYIYMPGLNGSRTSYVGSKVKVAWECYTGVPNCKSRFWYVDGNPFNLTRENLVPKKINTRLKKIEANFVLRTVEWMESREKWCERKGIDPEDFWSVMGFPCRWKSTLKFWRERVQKARAKTKKSKA